MRRFLLISLLAAASIAPSVASAQHHDRGQNRGPARVDSGNRFNAQRPQQRSEAPRRQFQPPQQFRQPQAQQQRAAPPSRANGRNDRNDRNWRGDRGNPGYRGTVNGQPRVQNAPRQTQRQQDYRRNGNRSYNAPAYRGNDGRRYEGNRGYSNNNRRYDRNDGRRWNNSWHRDNRYNWQNYRRYNRNLYHLPRYYAPYGWGYGYQRFGIGYTLNALLYSNDYWIDDPYYYRLPPAYGPYRWVRYYNDALLVDIYTGQVIDVVHDIFW